MDRRSKLRSDSLLSRSDRTGGDHCPQRAYVFDHRAIWKDRGDKPPPDVRKQVLTRRDEGSLSGKPVLAVSVRPPVVAVEGVANAHLGAAIPNNDFYEQLVFSTEHIKRLRKQNELPIVDGFITAPETPGLGLDVDRAALDKTALAVV